MTRKQDSAKGRIEAEDLKRLLAEDRDLLKAIVEETLQQVLEAEMDEGTAGRQGRAHSGAARVPLGLLQPHAGDTSRQH